MDPLAIALIAIFGVIVVGSLILFSRIVARSKALAQQKDVRAKKKAAAYAEKMADPAALEFDELFEMYSKATGARKKCRLLAGLVEKWSDNFGEQGQVEVRENDSQVEWRGLAAGHPARVHFGISKVKIRIKHAGELCFELEYDRKIRQSGETGTAWSEDDTVRVFVGKKVFIQCEASMAEEHLRPFLAHPAAIRLEVVEAMARHGMEELSSEEGKLEANLSDPFRDLSQLATRISGTLSALAKLASSSGEAVDQVDICAIQVRRLTCGYCQVEYVEAGNSCPNCGAAAA